MTTERLPGFSQVTACVFDAYGTLFDVHSAVRHGGAALEDKATAVSELWRQKQLEYTWLRSLMGAHAELRQVTYDSLEFALADHGVVDAELHEERSEARRVGKEGYSTRRSRWSPSPPKTTNTEKQILNHLPNE